jgi:ferredoxin
MAIVRFMTGTGNTRRAAAVIADSLSAAGWSVECNELRKGRGVGEKDRGADLFVLAFPVLGFGMPSLIRGLLRGLRGEGRAAAVFATWGGHHLGALREGGAFLRRKGFRVIAAGGGAYPFNWTQLFNPPEPRAALEMIGKGDAAARGFGEQLHAAFESGKSMKRGSILRVEHPILTAVMGRPVSLIYSSIGRFGLGAMFAADPRCDACGRCVKECPAGAIVMAGRGERRRPRWRMSCQGCNRCINSCPKEAVQFSVLRAAVHLPVNIAVFIGVILGLNALAGVAALPLYVSIPAWIVLFLALTVYGSRFFFALLEPLLFALESLPPLRRLVSHTWTAGFRRYMAP